MLCGCNGGVAQPGETPSEVNRRHAHVLNTHNQQLMADIDTFLLIDRPSKLGDLRVP